MIGRIARGSAGQAAFYFGADGAHIGPPFEFVVQSTHDFAHVAQTGGARSAYCGFDMRVDLGIGKLLRQVAGDEIEFKALYRGEIITTGGIKLAD